MVTGLMKSVFFLCASLYTEWCGCLRRGRSRFAQLRLSVPHHTLQARGATERASQPRRRFALLGDNTSAFLVLLALLPALVAVACIPVLITFPSRTSSSAEGMATRRVFFIAGGITLVLAVYMAVIGVAEKAAVAPQPHQNCCPLFTSPSPHSTPPAPPPSVMLQSEYPASLGVGTAFVPFAFCTMAILMGVYVTLPFLHDALKARSVTPRRTRFCLLRWCLFRGGGGGGCSGGRLVLRALIPPCLPQGSSSLDDTESKPLLRALLPRGAGTPLCLFSFRQTPPWSFSLLGCSQLRPRCRPRCCCNPQSSPPPRLPPQATGRSRRTTAPLPAAPPPRRRWPPPRRRTGSSTWGTPRTSRSSSAGAGRTTGARVVILFRGCFACVGRIPRDSCSVRWRLSG